jgi:hypothetical protein
MFPGLRHHTFVGRDDQHQEIEPARTGDHGSYKFFVTRYVDDGQTHSIAEFEGRESQFDGDPTRLFLWKTIEVASGQRANQRGLSVIDMAGRTEHEMPGRVRISALYVSVGSQGARAQRGPMRSQPR